MAKRRGRKSVDRSRYREYLNVAEHFYQAGKDSFELEYHTAAGVLVVHSAIAYADALCIKLSGQRSAGENHEDVIAILESVVADSDDKKKAIQQLRRIIEEKTLISYSGELYTASGVGELMKRLERFREWAVGILNR